MTNRLKQAITVYFETKARQNNMFLSTEQKNTVCNEILAAVREDPDMSYCEIVPGLILMGTISGRRIGFTQYNYKSGRTEMMTDESIFDFMRQVEKDAADAAA